MPRRPRRPPRAGALTELPPLRIAGQIVVLQALFYAVALVLTLFAVLVAGRSFEWGLVFGWEAVRGDVTQGWLTALLWVLDGGLFMSLAMVFLIGRSRLVPDFALTLHFLHLMVAALYSGRVPRNAMWWAAMGASSGVAIALGMWGCRYRELQPIAFGGSGGGANGAAAGAEMSGANGVRNGEAGGPAHEDGDEEHGYSRGRGRTRGRDGAGEYEMVKMNGDAGG